MVQQSLKYCFALLLLTVTSLVLTAESTKILPHNLDAQHTFAIPGEGTSFTFLVHDSIIITQTSDTISRTLSSSAESVTDTLPGAYITTTYTTRTILLYILNKTTIEIISYRPPAYPGGRIEITGRESTTKRDSIFLRYDTILSVEEISTPWGDGDYDRHLRLYPNPTPDKLFVEMGTLMENPQDLSIDVFDERGRFIMSEDITLTDRKIIDLSHLPTANYHFVINWSGRNFDRKIIKW